MKYPKQIGINLWLIEVRDTNGKYREAKVHLKPDALYQMGWDLAEGNDEHVMVYSNQEA